MKMALLGLLMLGSVTTLVAQESHFRWVPVQLSFCPEMQVVSKEVVVRGLKLNLFAGENDVVRGLDLGIFGRSSSLVGLQINAGSYVDGKATGVQLGLINGAKDSTGLAIGAVNYLDGGLMQGVTIGLVNATGEVAGAQIGIVNYCRAMTGVQIGLLNFIQEKKIRCMPFMNIYW